MKKTILFLAFCLSVISLTAQDKVLQDSLFFLKTKAEFAKFEQAHGHYIQTPNVKMHYLTWGEPTKTPIVWVHGTISNSYELFGFADSLVKKGYYVIAIDYYGHGFTPIPNKEISLYHVADDIKFLLDNLKIKKAVIGGWSRGGSVATAFYDAYPNSVLGLILEDGGSVAAPTTDHKKSIDSLSVEMTKRYQEYVQFMSQTYDSDFEVIYKNGDLNKKADVFVGLAAIKQNSSGKWVIGLGISELIGFTNAEEMLIMTHRPSASKTLFGTSYLQLNPEIVYRNLDVPMLILDPVSENDFMPFEAENAKLQQAHPEWITHKIYKETSHALKYEQPDAFLKDIELFLSRIKATEITLPDSRQEQLQIKSLDWTFKELSVLPADIKVLENLTVLKLHNNKFSVLPPDIKALKKLRELVLSNNELSALPDEIKALKNLRELDLGNNNFTEFPVEILALKNLVRLDLSDNYIKSIPAEMAQLRHLRYLTLDISNFSNDEEEKILKMLPKCEVSFRDR